MKRLTLLAGVTLLALTGSPAMAACLDEITALSPGTTTGSNMPAATGSVSQAGIAKDGNTAPLQPAPGAASGATQNSGMSTQQAQNAGSQGHPQGLAKDGSTMPMANQPGGGAPLSRPPSRMCRTSSAVVRRRPIRLSRARVGLRRPVAARRR